MKTSNYIAEKEALRQTIIIATSLSQELALNPHPLPQLLRPDRNMIPNLSLTFPPDILAPIADLQIPNNVRQIVLQRFDRLFKDLRQRYNSAYLDSCLSTFHRLNGNQDYVALRPVFQARFQSRCIPMVQSYVSLFCSETARYHLGPSDIKQSFRNEFTPALEKYFEYNAYPSAADRLVLARKTTMSPRQIEVWFQNHRNRAKKEGKSLKRMSSSLPLELALKVVEDCSLSESWDASDDDSSEIESVTKDVNQILQLTSCIEDWDKMRPVHAFPSVYSPNTPDPFQSENGFFKFLPPSWIRTPAKPSIKTSLIDMDEFIDLFASKLQFRDGSIKKQGSSPSGLSGIREPWFAATVTVPFPAPLPSLIPNSQTYPPLLSSLESSITTTLLSRSERGVTPSGSSLIEGEVLRSGKISPFPRRCFPSTPANPSSLSGSISLSPFSSELSLQSRKSSISSLSSNGPITPPLSPVSNAEPLRSQKPDLFKLFGLDAESVALLTNISSPDFNFNSPVVHHPTIAYDATYRFPFRTSNYLQAQS